MNGIGRVTTKFSWFCHRNVREFLYLEFNIKSIWIPKVGFCLLISVCLLVSFSNAHVTLILCQIINETTHNNFCKKSSDFSSLRCCFLRFFSVDFCWRLSSIWQSIELLVKVCKLNVQLSNKTSNLMRFVRGSTEFSLICWRKHRQQRHLLEMCSKPQSQLISGDFRSLTKQAHICSVSPRNILSNKKMCTMDHVNDVIHVTISNSPVFPAWNFSTSATTQSLSILNSVSFMLGLIHTINTQK